MTLEGFIFTIMCLCFKHQGSVTSWGRTVKHNKEVGGVPNSHHMIWFGCDVVLDVMEKNLAFEENASFLGLKAILEGDHYHLQPTKLSA